MLSLNLLPLLCLSVSHLQFPSPYSTFLSGASSSRLYLTLTHLRGIICISVQFGEIESGHARAHRGHRAARAKRKHRQTHMQLKSRCAYQTADLLQRSLLTSELHPRTRASLNVEINGRVETKTVPTLNFIDTFTCQCLFCH